MDDDACQRCGLLLDVRPSRHAFIVYHVHIVDGARVLRRVGTADCSVPVARIHPRR